MRLTCALFLIVALTSCERQGEPERPDARQAASLDDAEAMLDEDASDEAANRPSDQ